MSIVTKLHNTFYEKVWGSTRLSPWFPDSPIKIGEVWFDAPASVPLLVKFLFTTENLSVQVHPDDEYAQRHHQGSNGKTEMWHILRADPGAKIALGLTRDVSAEELREASISGSIMRLLNWVEVKAGDTFFTPARTIHAIGAGVALCEIQQISDITYRLYDYGRDRELHMEHGVAVSDLSRYRPASLDGCRYFQTSLIAADADTGIESDAEDFILIVLEGRGTLQGQHYQSGDAWHVSGSTAEAAPECHSRYLLTYVPTRYS